MLDFRIATFLAVCEHMNFTKAAEALNITQPAVSHHIHYLEEEYQVRLFHYQGKKISLTPAGQELQSAAITMKHDELHLRSKLKQLGSSNSRLIFGATLTIGEFVMPKALARYIRCNPRTPVTMVVADTKELLEKLNKGLIDFAIVEGFFPKSEYDCAVYRSEPYIAACAPDYPFSRSVSVIEDLLGERLIVREKGSGTRNVLERYLEGRNLTIDNFATQIELNNINALKALTIAGCGITFLYEAAALSELKAGLLMKIPLAEFNITHDFTFIWRTNSIYGDYYQELFKQLS